MKKQNNFFRIPLLFSVIFFCLSFLAVFFLNREINNNNHAAQSREQEWQTEMQRREEIKALDRSVKIIEGERGQLETHFAKSSDVVPFLDMIEGLASKVEAKAEVTSVDILEDSTGLMVGMKATGTFSGLYRFLTLLENSPYALEFVGMDLHKETASGGAESKNVTISKWNVIFKLKLLSFIQ